MAETKRLNCIRNKTKSCNLASYISINFWNLSKTFKNPFPCSRGSGGLKTRVFATPPSSKPTSPELLISVNGTSNDPVVRQNPEKRPYLLFLVYFSLFLSHTLLSKQSELLMSSKVPFFLLSFRPWNMASNALTLLSSLIGNRSFKSKLRHCFLCKAFSDSPPPGLGWCLLKAFPWHLDLPHIGTCCAILKRGLFTYFTARSTVSSRKVGLCPFSS